MTRAAVTYVTVSDARFFAGTVALVNSLRLAGNGGDVVVLDCGLRARQREVLATEARVVPVAGVPDVALAKPSASGSGSGELVFVDSDALVCGSLSPIVERARAGAVCLFPDHPATRGKRQDECWAFFERLGARRAHALRGARRPAGARPALRPWAEALRPGWAGRGARAALDATHRGGVALAGRLPPRVRSRLLGLRDRFVS